jgi:hypothetical protein
MRNDTKHEKIFELALILMMPEFLAESYHTEQMTACTMVRENKQCVKKKDTIF